MNPSTSSGPAHPETGASVSPHAALAGALQERLEVIGDREAYKRDPEAHLRRLQAVSEKITHLQQALPAPVHPQLAHYLERCSYDKALAFLREEQGGANNSGL